MYDQTIDAGTLKQYLADDPPTIVPLAIKPHFEALNDKEKKYAHYISRGALAGTRINLRQVSPESEGVYDFILALHKACNGRVFAAQNTNQFQLMLFTGNYKELQKTSALSEDDIKDYLNYAAQFLGNTGNYKSFGDSKFIPRIPQSKFAVLAKASPETEQLYRSIEKNLYESSIAKMHLGYPDAGHVSTYYPDSPGITKAEIDYTSDFLKNKGLLPENTRLRKTSDGNFELLIASAVSEPTARDVKDSQWTLDGPLQGKTLKLVYGDHHTEMGKIASNLAEAKKNALNSSEEAMQAEYVKAFHDGSMQAHMDSQRHWIKDKGPMVESNIGFIETYRDPHGIRGEWEGFAAMVNKERTRAFGELVRSAPAQIPKLPWPAAFEKDTFLAPDFTSLEVLTFAGSGIPAVSRPQAD